jgi:agmatine deiminase
MVRRMSAGETVRLIVKDASPTKRRRAVFWSKLALRRHAGKHRVSSGCPTNRGWTRDFGPFLFAIRTGARKAPSSTTASTAGRSTTDWKLDDAVPAQMASRFQHRLFPVTHKKRTVVLEGGGLDVNGRGTLLTTEECFLDQEVQCRNPGFTRGRHEPRVCRLPRARSRCCGSAKASRATTRTATWTTWRAS